HPQGYGYRSIWVPEGCVDLTLVTGNGAGRDTERLGALGHTEGSARICGAAVQRRCQERARPLDVTTQRRTDEVDGRAAHRRLARPERPLVRRHRRTS